MGIWSKKQKDIKKDDSGNQLNQENDVVKSFIDKVQNVQEIRHYETKLPEFDVLENKTLDQISNILDSIIPTNKIEKNEQVTGEDKNNSRFFKQRKIEGETQQEGTGEYIQEITQEQKEAIFNAFLSKKGFSKKEIDVDYLNLLETADFTIEKNKIGKAHPLHVLYSSLLKEQIVDYNRFFKYLKFRQQMIKLSESFLATYELSRYSNFLDKKMQSVTRMEKSQALKVDKEIRYTVDAHNSYMVQVPINKIEERAKKSITLCNNQVAMLELFMKNSGYYTGKVATSEAETKEFLKQFLLLYKERVETMYDEQRAKEEYLTGEKKLMDIFKDSDEKNAPFIVQFEKEMNAVKKESNKKLNDINETLIEIRKLVVASKNASNAKKSKRKNKKIREKKRLKNKANKKDKKEANI